MKKGILRAERKFFPSFELKLSPKTAIKFVVEALLLFLFASVGEFGYALALALFAGLVYARQNILALTPVFIVAVCVFRLEWWTLLYCVSPIVMLVALYVVFFKLKRNVPLWSVALSVLVGMFPYIICRSVLSAAYFEATVSTLIAVVMTFCVGISAYAVFVRGFVLRHTVDETICGGALLAVGAMALSGVNIFGFYLFYAVAAFAILFSSVCAKPQTTLYIAILLGMGAAVGFLSLTCLAAVVLIGAVAVTLSPFTKWCSALGIFALQALLWLTEGYVGAGWRTLIMTSLGIIPCLCVPKNWFMRIKDYAKSDNRRSFANIVNRRGRELAAKLSSAGNVFYEMSRNMENMAVKNSAYSAQKLAAEVAKNYCGKCADRDACFGALGDDTHSVIAPMAEAALSRGKVTILDMPPFITGRCTRMHSLASVINSCAEAYAMKRELSDGLMLGKKLMSEQFAGMSLILDSLAADCAKQINFAGSDIEYIKSELLKHNIVASEIVASGEDRTMSVTMIVRACDSKKAILPKLMSKYLRTHLNVARIEERGERRLVTLESAPLFEVAYGIAERARGGESVSGDSKSVLCPSSKLRLFAICDGMGSGENASATSKNAVSMIESFYRAGLESGIILSLVNKLLKMSLEDSFTSLDICVIDSSTGGLDVIKLGSAAGFIVRNDSIELIQCSQPPAGILDSVQPLTSRYQLYDGDMVIMMSDGVFDALESAGVAEAVDAIDTHNPQTLADELLHRAVEAGAQDDCTVMVMRLFCV